MFLYQSFYINIILYRSPLSLHQLLGCLHVRVVVLHAEEDHDDEEEEEEEEDEDGVEGEDDFELE